VQVLAGNTDLDRPEYDGPNEPEGKEAADAEGKFARLVYNVLMLVELMEELDLPREIRRGLLFVLLFLAAFLEKSARASLYSQELNARQG
jgi:hypothetical protein